MAIISGTSDVAILTPKDMDQVKDEIDRYNSEQPQKFGPIKEVGTVTLLWLVSNSKRNISFVWMVSYSVWISCGAQIQILTELFSFYS